MCHASNGPAITHDVALLKSSPQSKSLHILPSPLSILATGFYTPTHPGNSCLVIGLCLIVMEPVLAEGCVKVLFLLSCTARC